MSRLCLFAAVFLCACVSVSAQDNSDLQQLLISACQRSQLAYNPSGPYVLDVDFVAQTNVPERGHMTLKWEANDRWWRQIDLGEFHQTEVKKGEWHYTSRNASFTALRATDLIELLRFAYEAARLTAKKEKHRTENGVEMNCIEVDHKGLPEGSHEICLSAGLNDILLDNLQFSKNVQRRAQFSDYFDFGAHRYPRKLELIEDSSKVITANIVNLQSAPFDESLLAPPSGGVARRECDGMKHAMPVKALNFQRPLSADKRIGGTVAVTLTVQTDGTVSDVQFEETAGQMLDTVTLKALRSAKFAPAMCGSEPVVSDFIFRVDFAAH
jgi:TonB family protein